ncbi:hypothetical protein SteCoe_23767 [Stentor coeruleus]|uniref:Uncharacterized protein n=1 Tax=Stentor coeruleus TaxID=5963 RepID=A0A1R2BJ30_9CILI|nr:hypothetical protein SteCoe_23767 [Stentor coeruleus]
MLSVERIENTLQIGKSTCQMCNILPLESSKGLSSGHLEVFKTESELCLRPGSPERYKSTINFEGITPHTKISSQKDSFSQCSFPDAKNFHKNCQTPIKDLSLSLDFSIEDVPDIGTSFFSSANEAREMPLFESAKETEKDNPVSNSFASTNTKAHKLYDEILKLRTEIKKPYKNNCKIECSKCCKMIVTDLKITYPTSSILEKLLCSLCISADKAVKCTYFCNNCKRFITLRIDELEFNFN